MSKLRLLVLFGLMPGAVGAQEWTETRVVERAGESSVAVRQARLRASAADGLARAGAGVLWPTVHAEAGWTRSDDPVFAFGTKLRQGRFGESDFGLGALNQPGAVEDWSTGVEAAWRVLAPAAWSEADAGRAEATAASWGIERARAEITLAARTLFHRALAADARVASAQANLEARVEAERVMRRRVEEGALMEADALQAAAETSAARAELEWSHAMRADARARLAHLLALSPDSLGTLVDSVLPGDAPAAPSVDPSLRADVRALGALEEAARGRASAARRARLPSVSTFLRWDTHAPDPFDGTQSRWTGGIALSVPLFTGFSLEGRVEAARASAEEARLLREDAEREATLQIDEAYRNVQAGRQALAASDAAVQAAEQALRRIDLRFAQGLATPGDLLEAQARTASLRTRAVDARARYAIAWARFDWATTVSNDSTPEISR